MDKWQALTAELQKQAEATFHSSEETVEVESRGKSDFDLMLISGTRKMELRYLPERNVVRWETSDKYGFERIPEIPSQLAAQLIVWARASGDGRQ